ncbi:MAG TPA: GNAT family N-acetyltransferase [Acidimicrobiales bacterium]|nr:GNAT family N-acetyltransferase [Acidimicrobiales bacterium]
MATTVRNNGERSRYEIYLDDRLAGVADYEAHGPVVTFPHTEIEPDLRGRGLAAELVRAALDDVRGTGRAVVPHCWYVARFIDEHPEYQDLLAA